MALIFPPSQDKKFIRNLDLVLGLPDPTEIHERLSHSLPHRSRKTKNPSSSFEQQDQQHQAQFNTRDPQQQPQADRSPPLLTWVAVAVCLVALVLPTEGQVPEDSVFKDVKWAHLSFSMKMGVAYVLGLLSMIVIRVIDR